MGVLPELPDIDVDHLKHNLLSVLGAALGGYLALRRYYKAHAKRIKALEDEARKHDPSFAPPEEDADGYGRALVGILTGGKKTE